MAGSISTISQAGSSVATAAAGTAIATLSHSTQVTQKGVYRITAYAAVGAAPGANDVNNIVAAVGSTTVVIPVVAVAGYASEPVSFNATLDGSTDVVLKVGGNAAVAAYSGLLTAEYAGPMGGLRR
jgi:hypothetical protein